MRMFENTVFLPDLSQQHDRTVPEYTFVTVLKKNTIVTFFVIFKHR